MNDKFRYFLSPKQEWRLRDSHASSSVLSADLRTMRQVMHLRHRVYVMPCACTALTTEVSRQLEVAQPAR